MTSPLNPQACLLLYPHSLSFSVPDLMNRDGVQHLHVIALCDVCLYVMYPVNYSETRPKAILLFSCNQVHLIYYLLSSSYPTGY